MSITRVIPNPNLTLTPGNYPNTNRIHTYDQSQTHRFLSTTSISETSIILCTHRSYKEHFDMQVNREKRVQLHGTY